MSRQPIVSTIQQSPCRSPRERDPQLRLRGFGEPGAHRNRLPGLGPNDRLPARLSTRADGASVRSDGAATTAGGPNASEFLPPHTLSPTDFILRKDGICRLHPQLARHVAQLTVSGSTEQLVHAALVKRLKYKAPYGEDAIFALALIVDNKEMQRLSGPSSTTHF